jgi:hypothetical protein
MSNYRPNVAERPAPGQWYDHDIDYAENSETDLNVFFYGLSLKVVMYPTQSNPTVQCSLLIYCDTIVTAMVVFITMQTSI